MDEDYIGAKNYSMVPFFNLPPLHKIILMAFVHVTKEILSD